MPRGGARPNSGPAKGTKYKPTIEKEQIRARVRELVAAEVDPMTQAQIAHAKGINYLVARHRNSGKFVKLTKDLADKIISGEDSEHDMVEIWEKEPSTQAFTDLMNRAADKPTEHHEHTGDEGGPIKHIFSWKK